MSADDPRLVSMIKTVAGYHPVGIICNWLVISVLIAAVGIAVFKGKTYGAVLLVVTTLAVRFLVMYLLRIYLARKYQ